MSIELQPGPRPGQQCRKAEDEEPGRVRRNGAARSQPQAAHREDRDANRLEDGALLVLGPAADAAPHGREDAGKAGQAAKNPVEKSNAGIRRGAAALDWLHRRSGEAVSAIDDKQSADQDADKVALSPAENRNAQRNAERRPDQERPQPAPSQRMSQFPD